MKNNKVYYQIVGMLEKGKLAEQSVYLVIVKFSKGNPAHYAVLFTGFKNGSYLTIYNNTYEEPHKLTDVYDIKIVRKLASLDGYPKDF